MSAIGLPPHILCLFQSRRPLEYVPFPKKSVSRPYSGLADYIECFEEAGNEPPVLPFEAPKQKKERLKQEKTTRHKTLLREKIAKYNPKKDLNLTGDPFKTLFVASISYETTEKKLKKEFSVYGAIKRIRLIYERRKDSKKKKKKKRRDEDDDDNGDDAERKSRGYAFIEYENDRDMIEAYKQGDGKKIDGRRVKVDVERARTVPGWLPRRLGGGRGPPRGANTRKKGEPTSSSSPPSSYLPSSTYSSSSHSSSSNSYSSSAGSSRHERKDRHREKSDMGHEESGERERGGRKRDREQDRDRRRYEDDYKKARHDHRR